jgi:hypothetical protein
VERPSAEIEFICRGHARREPTVTVHEDHWAYCRGGYADADPGHLWIAIAPMNASELKWKQVGLVRENQTKSPAS